MPIFKRSIILERQKKFAKRIGDQSPIVLVASGDPIGKPGGLDQTYPFLPHPEYYWLTGSRRSGGVMAHTPDAGWIHFVRKANVDERLWEGDPEVPDGEDVEKFPDWLKAQSGKPMALLGNTSVSLFSTLKNDPKLNGSVREELDQARRSKDRAELELMARAVSAAAAGFKKAREFIRPGVTERQIQIELEAEMCRSGANATCFSTIVGTGTHTAVLHFEPTDRKVEKNDLVLIDAGAEIHEYCSDVTRTYSATGRFTPEQQAVYDIVLAAQQAVIDKCRVGVEWHDAHRAAAMTIGQGLKDLGILKGSLEDLAENGAVALFFPHGVGHLVGLRVRDVGGHAPGRPEGRMCCGARVRVDLPLEEGFVMTAEPGLYFVPAILDGPERRKKFKNAVAWDSLAKWRPVGGVRIEDNVLVTAQAPKVLTAVIPK